jgi:hypothetical protein
MNAKRTWLQKSAANSSGFWKSVSEIRNKRHISSIASLLKQFPSLCVAIEEINDSLCKSFSEPPDWAQINHDIVNKMVSDSCSTSTWNPIITIHAVYYELRNLNVKKAAGSDGLPSRLLRVGAEVFAPILAHLINLSAETKEMPQLWKIANIVPIPKKRNPTTEDLRPISLLPIFGKICEKMLLASVKNKLIGLYGADQFGFRPQSSTTLSHIKLHNFITDKLESSVINNVLLLSFDMSRAFDSLDHGALMRTLLHSGLPMDFVNWCADYLQNRQQKVIVEHLSSTARKITSGVPQGSIIAPFLFCIQMRTAKPFSTEALILKYADDILIAIPVSDTATISATIQNETTNMKNWCKENGLRLNTNKTKCLLVSKKGKAITTVDGNYAATLSTEIKFLGLIYNSDCNWKSHISYIVSAASRMIYVLRQLKLFLPKPLLIRAYRAIIRSRLEYCNAVFVGLPVAETARLESIQKSCHRIICGPQCCCSNFQPLQERRIERAMHIFSQMKHKDHLLHDMYPPLLPLGKRLFLPFLRTNRRLNSFILFCTRHSN